MARSGAGVGSAHEYPPHALASPWWINHLEGDERRHGLAAAERHRTRREFTAVACQLGVAAWLIGVLVMGVVAPSSAKAPDVVAGPGRGGRIEAAAPPARPTNRPAGHVVHRQVGD